MQRAWVRLRMVLVRWLGVRLRMVLRQWTGLAVPTALAQ